MKGEKIKYKKEGRLVEYKIKGKLNIYYYII